MRKINKLPRVLKINDKKDELRLIVTFNNNEQRVIDFKVLFNKWKIKKGDIEYPLLKWKEFKKVKISDNTLTWDNVRVKLENDEGKTTEYSYQMDPQVLYENSFPAKDTFVPYIGNLVRRVRLKAGLSQNELALRSGTTKSYLSRLENDKSGIEISTLQKIVETGLGKKLKVEIE
ncbi:MAG: helix-turn-helix transcriptional regulator [Bacteroidetes bacterium]|nr:helix-turn-helix transcriptional regulator [Bacteroidota bacterium]MBX7044605.1 helix-turn-helix domain-containing protein [Ignavibacteria bacterium]